MRCNQTKSNGTRCEAHALNGEEFCLFHSKNKEVRKVKPFTKEKMIHILRRQIRKLEKETEDPIARSGEIRRNLQMIQELKGEKLSSDRETEFEDSFEKKLKKWRKEEEQKKKKELNNA